MEGWKDCLTQPSVSVLAEDPRGVTVVEEELLAPVSSVTHLVQRK